MILALHFNHYTDPWPFYIFCMICPNWSHLDTSCFRRIFLSREPMYALISGCPALHGTVVVLGPYKQLVIPTDDTWTPELHKFNEVLSS